MMQFSEKSINKFVAIYEQEFREPISRDDAIALARRLVNLYRLFLRPLPSEQGERSEMAAESGSCAS